MGFPFLGKSIKQLGFEADQKSVTIAVMNTIDILIGNQRYELKGNESPEHLEEVAQIVRRRVDSLRKKNPSLSLQKAAILAAFDLASDLIKAKRKSSDHRSAVLAKAQKLLEKVEWDLQLSR
ncbi:cell division protein ZapA [bacterium]|nr:cell division protein ZapA [bacterium]